MVAGGNIKEVQRLLNPLGSIDHQPDVRYTDNDGFGAVHIAVIEKHLEILKTILQTDRTLLCMETENTN